MKDKIMQVTGVFRLDSEFKGAFPDALRDLADYLDSDDEGLDTIRGHDKMLGSLADFWDYLRANPKFRWAGAVSLDFWDESEDKWVRQPDGVK